MNIHIYNKNFLRLLFDRRNLVAWLIFFVSLSTTAIASYTTQHDAEKNSIKNFNIHVDNVIRLIQNRMHQNEQILLGGAGLFNAEKTVTRADWHTYISTLNLETNYPGIQGVGFSKIVHPEELPAHLKTIHGEGFLDYTVRPAGERALYSPVIYLEPFTKMNQTAFGYDLLSEKYRKEALLQALESGKTAISGKIKLVQEIQGKTQAGFLMVLPIYAKNTPLNTAEDYRRAIQGFVYSPFRAEDLMQGIMNQIITPIEFTIYDLDQVRDEALMYATNSELTEKNHLAKFSALRQLDIFQHRWTISFQSSQQFEAASQSKLTNLIIIMGSLLSLAVFLIISLQIYRRGNAEQMTKSMYADILSNQKELEESEARLRSIIETCPTAARIARIGASEVVFCNMRYLQLTETTVEQLGQMDPSQYYADQEVYKVIRAKLQGGEQIIDQLVELINPKLDQPKSKWVLASYFIIQYQGAPAVLAWFHEITDRIETERLKNEFISTVNHELRTPLTAINGALGLLNSGVIGVLPEQAANLVDLADKNTKRLMALVDDLLDMERIAAGKMAFDVRSHALMPLLQQAVESNMHYQSGRGIKFRLTGVSDLLKIDVDSQRFMQVMSNLLSNAIKYSPDGATVEILALQQPNQTVRINVTDFGAGIPKDFQNKIFEKFTQADSTSTRQKGGSGLGLAITRELVIRMRGHIDFTSEEGHGTTFYVEFPVHL